MGFWTGGKPLDSVIRKRAQVARAFAGFFKGTRGPPPVTTDKGVPHREWEDWNYPLRKDGTRREGKRRLQVWRDPATGRFSTRFSARDFARKQRLPTGFGP